jgi:hypothetical protein
VRDEKLQKSDDTRRREEESSSKQKIIFFWYPKKFLLFEQILHKTEQMIRSWRVSGEGRDLCETRKSFICLREISSGG